MADRVPEILTHYYRPFSRPFLSLSPLSDPELSGVLDVLARSEPLPYRLTHPAYLSERRRIEGRMRHRFLEKGEGTRSVATRTTSSSASSPSGRPTGP